MGGTDHHHVHDTETLQHDVQQKHSEGVHHHDDGGDGFELEGFRSAPGPVVITNRGHNSHNLPFIPQRTLKSSSVTIAVESRMTRLSRGGWVLWLGLGLGLGLGLAWKQWKKHTACRIRTGILSLISERVSPMDAASVDLWSCQGGPAGCENKDAGQRGGSLRRRGQDTNP